MEREEAIRRIKAWNLDSDDMEVLAVVIPELAESEDERIMKHLIEIVETYWGTTNDPGKAADLAYLEKQKGKMTAEEYESSELFRLKLKTKYANGYQDGLVQKEQKPVQPDTEKEYVHTLKSIIFDFLRGKQEVDRDYYQQIYDWLDGRLVEQEEQKSAEWSEEDEIYLQDALWCVKQAAKVAREENDMGACWSAERWLKSLRPPFKDKEMKLKILKYLSTRCSSLEFEEVEDYLNNLRPSWKPSEEQMNALLYAMSFVSPATKESVLLSEIYENLKK